MSFYCKWWDCPLEQVSELQQAQCENDGRSCVQCMEQADAEESAAQECTMELKDTVELMCSGDYKDRFRAEYYQTKIRYERLQAFNGKIKAAREDNSCPMPPHDCPDAMLWEQAEVMEKYLTILELRAEIEGIVL